MNSIVESMERVVADLSVVLSSDAVAGLSEADRVRVLGFAGEAFRRAEAVVVETIATCEPGFTDRFGCRSTNELLQRVVRVDAAGASRVGRASVAVARPVGVSSGERLAARYPALRLALLDGVIGVSGLLAATAPIDRCEPRISVEDRLAADAALAEYARGCRAFDDDSPTADADAPPATAEDLRQFAQIIAMALDPDGAEPDDRNAQTQRYVSIGRLRNGVHSLKGNLLPEVAAQLQLLIDAQCNPKTAGPPDLGVVFRESDEASVEGAEPLNVDPNADPLNADPLDADPFDADPAGRADGPTPAQKRHDALAAALGIAARHEDMPSLAGAAPTVVVHVEAEDLAAGSRWATVAGSGAPVPVGVAAQLACAGGVQRVLFDEGRIVGITVTDRVFTIHQRRAIIARDRECLIPGRHVPASWCEIHHVTEHARGGPTHTDNGVPLCWWHHRSLGQSGWEIRMNDGIPEIRGPAWWDPHQRWRTPRPRVPASLVPA